MTKRNLVKDIFKEAVTMKNQRMFDLLRYMRSELLVKELITVDEYDELAKDHTAVRRLEDYDKTIANTQRMEQALRHLYELFNDEGAVAEQYQDQLSVALERRRRKLCNLHQSFATPAGYRKS